MRFPGAGLRLSEEHGFVTGLVLRTALGIVLLLLVINDGGKLVSAQVKAESVARAAATAGADTWFRTHRADLAKSDALAAAERTDPGAQVLLVDIDQKVGTVTVQVVKSSDTLVVKRVGFLKKYATQKATDSETRTA
jgi:hypothetical protein